MEMTNEELKALVASQQAEIDALKQKNEELLLLSTEMNESLKLILEKLNRTTADKVKDFSNKVIDFNKDIIRKEREFSDRLVENIKKGGAKVAEAWHKYYEKSNKALEDFTTATKEKMNAAIDKSKEIYMAAAGKIKSLCNSMIRGFQSGKDKVSDTVASFKHKAGEIADTAAKDIDIAFDKSLDAIYLVGYQTVDLCKRAKDVFVEDVTILKNATNEHVITPCVDKIKEGIEYDKRTLEMIREKREIKKEAKKELADKTAAIKEETKKKLSNVER